MKVKELHPKDIALVTALHVAHRIQVKIDEHECEYIDLDPNFIIPAEYLSTGFLNRNWQTLVCIKDDKDLQEMLYINAMAWKEKNNENTNI